MELSFQCGKQGVVSVFLDHIAGGSLGHIQLKGVCAGGALSGCVKPWTSAGLPDHLCAFCLAGYTIPTGGQAKYNKSKRRYALRWADLGSVHCCGVPRPT